MKRLSAIAVLIVVAVFAFSATVAGAQQQPCDPYTQQCPSTSTPTSVEIAPIAGERPAAPAPSGTLPVTGGDIAGLAVLAAVLVGGGLLLVTISRRRRSEEDTKIAA